MYWACKLPAHLRDSIRFRVNGRSYHIPSLPFGWAFSPILAIETLSRSLVLQFPGTIILIQYLDDVLLISTNPRCLRLEANQLAEDLSTAGWKVSPKSDLEPKTSVTWLGKTIDGATFSMAQAPTYLAQVIKGWVKLACRTYTEKRARRLVGKILWAATPSRQPLPFLQGPMAWTTWGPPCAPFTPPRVLRSLCHAISNGRDQLTPNDHDNGLCMQGCQGCRKETTLNTVVTGAVRKRPLRRAFSMDLSIGDRVFYIHSNGLRPPATIVGMAEDGLLHLEYYQDGLRVVNRHCKMESTSFAIPSSDSPPDCRCLSPLPNTQSSPPPQRPLVLHHATRTGKVPLKVPSSPVWVAKF